MSETSPDPEITALPEEGKSFVKTFAKAFAVALPLVVFFVVLGVNLDGMAYFGEKAVSKKEFNTTEPPHFEKEAVEFEEPPKKKKEQFRFPLMMNSNNVKNMMGNQTTQQETNHPKPNKTENIPIEKLVYSQMYEKQVAVRLGELLKERYVDTGLLTEEPTEVEVSLYSADFSENKETMKYVMQGMYKQINVSIKPLGKFSEFAKCDVVQKFIDENSYDNCTSGVIKFDQAHYVICMTRVTDMDMLMSQKKVALEMRKIHNRSLDSIKADAAAIEMYARYYSNLHDGDENIFRIKYFHMIKEILFNLELAWMQHPSRTFKMKFRAYSVQDWFILGILKAFNALKYDTDVIGVGYNFALIMELWEHEKKPFVKFYFKNDLVDELKPIHKRPEFDEKYDDYGIPFEAFCELIGFDRSLEFYQMCESFQFYEVHRGTFN